MAKFTFETIQYLVFEDSEFENGWYYVPANIDPDDGEFDDILAYDSAEVAHRKAYIVLNSAIPAEDEGITNIRDLGDVFISEPSSNEVDNHRFLITSDFNINNFIFEPLDDVAGTAPSFGAGVCAKLYGDKILLQL